MGAGISYKATRAAIDEVRDDILSMRYIVKAGVYARSIISPLTMLKMEHSNMNVIMKK